MIKAIKILATEKIVWKCHLNKVLCLSLGSANFQPVACFERVRNKTILQRCM